MKEIHIVRKVAPEIKYGDYLPSGQLNTRTTVWSIFARGALSAIDLPTSPKSGYEDVRLEGNPQTQTTPSSGTHTLILTDPNKNDQDFNFTSTTIVPDGLGFSNKKAKIVRVHSPDRLMRLMFKPENEATYFIDIGVNGSDDSFKGELDVVIYN